MFIRGSKSLQKQVYSNLLKISPPKNENVQIKDSDSFHISAQNITCGYFLTDSSLVRWSDPFMKLTER